MHPLIRISIFSALLAGWAATGRSEGEPQTSTPPPVQCSTRPLWSVGRINGQPASEGGFPVRQAADPVVTIHSPAEIPQIIMPGQSLVIHLGELPGTRLSLRLDIIAKRMSESEYSADPERRRLRILFNGNPLWRRWFIDGHSRIEVFVPAAFTRTDGNLLVIENEGKQAAAFHAIRLDPYTPRGELLAALTGTQRLDGTTAADVSHTVLRLPPPGATPGDHGANEGDAKAEPIQAPRHMADAIQAARALAGTTPVAAMPGEAAKTVRTEWDSTIAAALRRGLLPVVDVRDGTGNPADWEWFATRYGGMVYAWAVSTRTAEDAIRARVGGARLYTLPTVSPKPAETTGTAVFIPGIADLLGGRLDRRSGLLRAGYRSAGLQEPAMGLWLCTPPSLQANLMRRRHGEQAAQSMMQWWMSGGDLLILEGGESGSDFFPDHTGRPSQAWNAVRLAFGIGEGAPRRAACSVIPDSGDDALGDTHWIAAENSAELVTTLLLPCEDDRERSIRLLAPVPWRGPTEGVVEGIRFGDRRGREPEPVAPRMLRLMAGSASAGAGTTDGGHVDLGLKLDGLLRVRFWPAGQPPENRRQRLKQIPADFRPPETLTGVFRIHSGPPPAGARFETLREADWPAGAELGSHSVETRPATRGIPTAEAATGDFRPPGSTDVRNVVPLDAQSLFVTFRPESAAHAVRLFQSGVRPGGGIQSMLFYARARVLDSGAPSPGSLQTRQRPVALWMGSPERRQRLELAPERWQLLQAPFNGFQQPGDDVSAFMLWTDPDTRQAVEVELNGMTALSMLSATGRLLSPLRSALRRVPDSMDVELLLEGQPGSPAVHRIRLERPVRIRRSSPAIPEHLEGMTVSYQPESQFLELFLEAMPAAEDGVSVAATKSRFPQVRPDPALARVLVRLELEH